MSEKKKKIKFPKNFQTCNAPGHLLKVRGTEILEKAGVGAHHIALSGCLWFPFTHTEPAGESAAPCSSPLHSGFLSLHLQPVLTLQVTQRGCSEVGKEQVLMGSACRLVWAGCSRAHLRGLQWFKSNLSLKKRKKFECRGKIKTT